MKAVVKYKDGSFANLEADNLIMIPNTTIVQAWQGESRLVGVFNTNTEEIVSIYLSVCKQ